MMDKYKYRMLWKCSSCGMSWPGEGNTRTEIVADLIHNGCPFGCRDGKIRELETQSYFWDESAQEWHLWDAKYSGMMGGYK